MFQTYVRIDPWDLVDEGVDSVLDRLAGECGATGVSVSMAHPAVAVFRPHQGISPRTFRSQGGLQYQPAKDTYAATRIRPVTADWLRKSNPLSAIAEGCVARGLTLRGRIACCHSEVLASRFDFCAVKDAFGDAHPGWLCPSNPDVREFLCALVIDLSTHYPFDSLEIISAGFPSPAAWNQVRMLCPDVGSAGEWLLSLCFCESCRQAAQSAGLDAMAAARSASVFLERSLAAGEPIEMPISDVLANDPLLRSYARWRTAQEVRLVTALGEVSQCRLVIEHDGETAAGGEAVAWGAPGNCAIVSSVSADDVESVIRAALAYVDDVARIEIAVDACPPRCADSAALVRSLSTAVRIGVRAASIDTYGLLPRARLAWIKQASRYAQRESE